MRSLAAAVGRDEIRTACRRVSSRLISKVGPFCWTHLYPDFLSRNKPIEVANLKNPPRGILRFNPVRVLQQSLGSPPCGAPQVRKWRSHRTPLGFIGYCGCSPWVRCCHGDPWLCCKTPLWLRWHSFPNQRSTRGKPRQARCSRPLFHFCSHPRDRINDGGRSAFE